MSGTPYFADMTTVFGVYVTATWQDGAVTVTVDGETVEATYALSSCGGLTLAEQSDGSWRMTTLQADGTRAAVTSRDRGQSWL